MSDLATVMASTIIFLFAQKGTTSIQVPIGTGFIIGYPVPSQSGKFVPIIVTAKHVLGNYTKIYGRFSPKEGNEPIFIEYDIDAIKKAGDLWEHPDEGVDIIAFRTLNFENAKYIIIDLDSIAKRETFRTEDIKATDRVIFPCLLVNFMGFSQNYPVLRNGTIALIPEEAVPLKYAIGNKTINTRQEIIMIDAISIPGASGSPVFLWPGPRLKNNAFEVGGQKPYLLGIMHGFYTAVPREISEAESTTTKGSFAENSGIAIVFPSWKILEIMELPSVKERMNTIFEIKTK